jgi:hypothetical protein
MTDIVQVDYFLFIFVVFVVVVVVVVVCVFVCLFSYSISSFQAAYNDDVSNNVSIDINNKRVTESNQALYCKYVFALFDTVYGRERASQKYHYEVQTSPTVPQFKLHHPLKIMGRVINWIDVKHVYGGVCVNIIWADAMKKRYCRLIQALGPGALIVRFGFCQGYLRKFQEWCPQLLLLDGSYLSDEPNDAERF